MARIEIFPINTMLSSSSTQDAFKDTAFSINRTIIRIIIMKTRSLCLGSLYPTLNGGTFESEVRRRRVNQSSPTDGDHLNTTESYRGSGKCFVDK